MKFFFVWIQVQWNKHINGYAYYFINAIIRNEFFLLRKLEDQNLLMQYVWTLPSIYQEDKAFNLVHQTCFVYMSFFTGSRNKKAEKTNQLRKWKPKFQNFKIFRPQYIKCQNVHLVQNNLCYLTWWKYCSKSGKHRICLWVEKTFVFWIL